jgi:hypothetical protein
MADYGYNEIQSVALNSPIIFRSINPCQQGFVYHEDETGNFLLRNILSSNSCNNKFIYFQVTFNGNIALPEGATVVPIAVSLVVNGESRPTSRAIFTPTAVDEYGNVTATAVIKVPRCCCFTLGVEPVVATSDATIVPAPVINVQNANLTISRVA